MKTEPKYRAEFIWENEKYMSVYAVYPSHVLNRKTVRIPVAKFYPQTDLLLFTRRGKLASKKLRRNQSVEEGCLKHVPTFKEMMKNSDKVIYESIGAKEFHLAFTA